MRLFFDIECYRNYFLACFTNEKGQTKSFEIIDNDRSRFDAHKMWAIMSHPDVELVSFNGNCYDMPVSILALAGKSLSDLKNISDSIIENNLKPWHVYRNYNLNQPNLNHIDLIEVAPGLVGLKLYGGRMHTKLLQDLPIPPDALIEESQLPLMRKYCKNDTLVTYDLFNTLNKEIDLRREMSKEYGVDLRSKSDAQIAEAVLKAEHERITGLAPPKIKIDYTSLFYEPPAYIKFSTPELRSAFETICNSEMFINDSGHVDMPKEIAKMKIKIGDSTYKIGIGGLHSQEKEVSYQTTDTHILIDQDVTSYYPNLMLNMDMSPPAFGEHFQSVYRKILEDRVAAKNAGDKVKSDSLKIVLNGTFGKTSNRYSSLYSPKMMIRTTITGQLSLLMLIEAAERLGIPAISANTDGVVFNCPAEKVDMLDRLVKAWEKRTGLNMEETRYAALYSRDVNNYIAVKPSGDTKAKGVYGEVSIRKNPTNAICNEAAELYVSQGIPYEDTIRYCKDLTKFITVKTVTGGAIKDGTKLGKAIRWYYSTSTESAIHYVKNNNTVARSEGAMPVMDLPDKFPNDIDYDWYIAETKDILYAINALQRPVLEKIPRRNSKAWKVLVEADEIYEDRKGKYQWREPQNHTLGPSQK